MRFGAVGQLAASLASTDFHRGALTSRRHKPLRFRNRNEFARAGASRSANVYVMQKNGDWRVLDGVGTKGNPRLPSLKRVLGERGLRVPLTTTRHDDHGDAAVMARIEVLVGATPSTSASAPQSTQTPSPAPAAKTVPSVADAADGDGGTGITGILKAMGRGGVDDPIICEVDDDADDAAGAGAAEFVAA